MSIPPLPSPNRDATHGDVEEVRREISRLQSSFEHDAARLGELIVDLVYRLFNLLLWVLAVGLVGVINTALLIALMMGK